MAISMGFELWILLSEVQKLQLSNQSSYLLCPDLDVNVTFKKTIACIWPTFLQNCIRHLETQKTKNIRFAHLLTTGDSYVNYVDAQRSTVDKSTALVYSTGHVGGIDFIVELQDDIKQWSVINHGHTGILWRMFTEQITPVLKVLHWPLSHQDF